MNIQATRKRIHARIDRLLSPISRALGRAGVRPNQITLFGTAVCLAAPLLLLAGQPVAAGVIWILGSALDLLDGALARHQQQVSRAGAFLDSNLDRLSEGALFAAVAYHFAALGAPIEAALTTLALLGSLMISYARARAEGLGAECEVGLVTRAERVLLLGGGLCFDFLAPAIYVLVVLTAITVAQRILHSLKELR